MHLLHSCVGAAVTMHSLPLHAAWGVLCCPAGRPRGTRARAAASALLPSGNQPRPARPQDHRVEDWVSHGLNLPQYAAAFRQAAITALDFPFLVSDGGASLQAELGVVSKLHQLQVRMLVLGWWWWWCVFGCLVMFRSVCLGAKSGGKGQQGVRRPRRAAAVACPCACGAGA